jgi:hypothetical protein
MSLTINTSEHKSNSGFERLLTPKNKQSSKNIY